MANFTWVKFGKMGDNTLGQIKDPGDGYYDNRFNQFSSYIINFMGLLQAT